MHKVDFLKSVCSSVDKIMCVIEVFVTLYSSLLICRHASAVQNETKREFTRGGGFAAGEICFNEKELLLLSSLLSFTLAH